MEIAKVTSKGQITIPIGIRKALGLREGDKVLFLEQNGQILMANSTMEAIQRAQAAFAGEAERAGLKDEEKVLIDVKSLYRMDELRASGMRFWRL